VDVERLGVVGGRRHRDLARLEPELLDQPLEDSRYPEPDYDDLGRARVLHVFRDRGGDEDEAFVPDDRGSRPAPAEPLLSV